MGQVFKTNMITNNSEELTFGLVDFIEKHTEVHTMLKKQYIEGYIYSNLSTDELEHMQEMINNELERRKNGLNLLDDKISI